MEGNRGIEENTLAILDTVGYDKVAQDLNDDRLSFLEAVRTASLVPQNGPAPTKKMFEAIFQILKNATSLDLIMASFQLLIELEKHFPRVYVSKREKSDLRLPSTAMLDLVVVEEAWSPFMFGSDGAYSEEGVDKSFDGSLDSSGFHLLIQDLATVVDKAKSEAFESKLLKNMLLLQYLINVLEADFFPRSCAYKENINWTLLKESMLNTLLGSRRIVYKNLIRDCLFAISRRSNFLTECIDGKRHPQNSCDGAVAIALPEVGKCTCMAVQKLLFMIMELDTSKNTADMQGLTTRTDGVRTPAAEIILDELTYNEDIVSQFFQAFDEPKWKLELIVQYFRKYIPKPSIRTRRSDGAVDDATFDGILKCFSESNNTKSITKKISSEDAQLLLAHAFQAYLSLSLQHSVEGISESKEGVGGKSLVDICKNMISAFSCLRRMDENVEITPFGQEALFTAETILSRKS